MTRSNSTVVRNPYRPHWSMAYACSRNEFILQCSYHYRSGQNLVKIIRIAKKSAQHVAMQIENNWLSQTGPLSPWPMRGIHRPRFHDHHRNQQSNQISSYYYGQEPTSQCHLRTCASNHRQHTTQSTRQTMPCQRLNLLCLSHRNARNPSIRESISRDEPHSRSSWLSARHRDMILNIPLILDLITIRNSRQSIVNESLGVANLKWLDHDYRVGEQVLALAGQALIKSSRYMSMEPPYHSPQWSHYRMH
jgi:hypothetical protein